MPRFVNTAQIRAALGSDLALLREQFDHRVKVERRRTPPLGDEPSVASPIARFAVVMRQCSSLTCFHLRKEDTPQRTT